MPDLLLTVDDVARVLRVKKFRAYELLRRGYIPAVRLGRQLRVAPAALDSFVRAGGRAQP